MRADDVWRPVDAVALPGSVSAWLDATPGRLVVAVDGPPCAGPVAFARSLDVPLRAAGRPVTVVDSQLFWRDASLRLEHGHEDVESYLHWLDVDALRRETLEPFAAGRPFLTSLRDPVTDRSTRSRPVEPGPGHVLVVAGQFLLGTGLPFDRTLHLHLPSAARRRRTPPAQSWTLPAFDRYDEDVRPVLAADVVVRGDRRTPAVRGGLDERVPGSVGGAP